jgi:hypothetical protein
MENVPLMDIKLVLFSLESGFGLEKLNKIFQNNECLLTIGESFSAKSKSVPLKRVEF